MDFNRVSSQNFINNLRCTICNNYLSYFPIYISITDQNICGRCEVPKDSINVRNRVYELVAQEIRFPCRYMSQGCVERLLAQDIPNHENQCSLRTLKCPASEFNLCQEFVSFPDTAQHCLKEHSDLVLKDGQFEINLTKSEETQHLFIKGNDLFIFKKTFDCDQNNLSVDCYSVDQNPILRTFEMCLYNSSRTACIKGTANRRSGLHDVCLGMFNNERDDGVNGKLTIKHKDGIIKKELSQSTRLLEISKCSKCTKYITSPSVTAYKSDNKSFCASCTSGLRFPTSFKTCYFDKFFEELILPCENEKAGCEFVSRPSLLKAHELHCRFGISSCPLSDYKKCIWTGPRKEVVAHIVKDHSDCIAEMSYFGKTLDSIRSHKYSDVLYILKFSKYFFRLSFSWNDKCFRWSLQTIEEYEDDFKYTIEILDNNNKDVIRKLMTTQSCTSLSPEKDVFTEKNDYCYFQLDQFKDMLHKPDNHLAYKINIFK